MNRCPPSAPPHAQKAAKGSRRDLLLPSSSSSLSSTAFSFLSFFFSFWSSSSSPCKRSSGQHRCVIAPFVRLVLARKGHPPAAGKRAERTHLAHVRLGVEILRHGKDVLISRPITRRFTWANCSNTRLHDKELRHPPSFAFLRRMAPESKRCNDRRTTSSRRTSQVGAAPIGLEDDGIFPSFVPTWTEFPMQIDFDLIFYSFFNS